MILFAMVIHAGDDGVVFLKIALVDIIPKLNCFIFPISQLQRERVRMPRQVNSFFHLLCAMNCFPVFFVDVGYC